MAEEPDKFFLADMTGLYAQHSTMWSVYTESIKILVSITSLPILAAAVLISINSKAGQAPASVVDFAQLPDVLVWTLVVLPFLDILMLGVVIHHRLVILFYARCLNGYRRIYLERWNAPVPLGAPATALVSLPMPTNTLYPEYYEILGPMGLIVHCCAFVNALYVYGATHSLWQSSRLSLAVSIATVIIFELWYGLSCRFHSAASTTSSGAVRPRPVSPPPAAPVVPLTVGPTP